MQATLSPLQSVQHYNAMHNLFLSPPISPSAAPLASRNNEYSSYHDDNNTTLPKDPRQWSREHVQQWLQQTSKTHNLPDVQSTRFVMNGKALCLMSPSMFISRVPLGGKLLYKDFQLRLCSAMHSV